MSKRKKKNGNKAKHADRINLITAVIQLITAILLIYQTIK